MDDAVRNIESHEMKSDESTFMLPGFRFHPTDEELVGFYLKRKIMHKPLSIELIKQLDIYKYDPWDLPKLATTGEKEWYFYCPRDRKYRNSARPNRVTGAGFWKATGTDRPIYSSEGASRCIGLKKSLVFYRGRAAKGIKTDWMMHEFRLPVSVPDSVNTKKYLDKNIPTNEAWAICRIFKKASSSTQRALSHSWASPIYDITTTSSSDIAHTIINNPFMTSSSNILLPPKITNPPLHFPGPCSRPLYDHTASENTRPFVDQFTVIPESYNIDASSLLQDMSASVFGEVFVKGSGIDGRDEFNGFSTVNGMPAENVICHAGDDKERIIGTRVVGQLDIDGKEWGVIRSGAMEYSSYNPCEGYWNRSNLMWDYSCPTELSTAYSTNNIYT